MGAWWQASETKSVGGAENMLSDTLKSIRAFENYPALRANENFFISARINGHGK